MGLVAMERFSDILMDHFMAPRNDGHMEAPDRVGVGGNPGQGPSIVLYLRLRENVIFDARFRANGCGVTIAAGSMLTEMIVNRSVEECRTISADQLAEALGGVPPDKAHSPILAITALRSALGSVIEER